MRFVSLRDVPIPARHRQHLARVPIHDKNCGFLYLMRLPGTDVYKIGWADYPKKQEFAVWRRFNTLHKDINRCLFPNRTSRLHLEIVRILPITYISLRGEYNAKELNEAILTSNENGSKNTSDWLDFSAKGAEGRWHAALYAFRVTVPDAITVKRTGKTQRELTEFFRFRTVEAEKVRQAFETGILPEFPELQLRQLMPKLVLSVAYFQGRGQPYLA